MAIVTLTNNDDDYTDPAGQSNTILGLDGNDIIRGLDGSDTLDGGTGADMLIGGAGADTYVVDDAGDDVVESRFDAGVDLVQSSISFKLSNAVENLTLTGSDNIDGTGNSQSNIVIGNSGNNVLKTGKGGFDTLIGGQGDDTYIEHVRSSGLSVVERRDEGTDTLVSLSGDLPANVENLIVPTSEFFFGRDHFGNPLDNIMIGNLGDDRFLGFGGNDTLVGGFGNDELFGLEGRDFLDGGGGVDDMRGGTEDDIYIVDTPLDFVIEFKNEGIDLVRSTSDFTLLPNVENLDLMGADDSTAPATTLPM